MYFGDHPFGGSRWGLHFDGQLRMEAIAESRNQLLLRPGVNFDVNETVQLTGGYAFIATKNIQEDGSRFDEPEHRFWEQLTLRQRLGRTHLVHRYRLEQRLLGNVTPNDAGRAHVDGYTYQNRVRYFLKAITPLGESSRAFAAFYNELMINFGANVSNNIFDQNRTYGALGFRLGEAGSLELGYLLQIVQEPSGSVIAYNHTLQIGFFSSRPIR
ncbi:MAG: hypothetical protein BMS9Abin37_0321 [Acidobacteriota bacterium]|nr:MAG: hypothetical protein BMS9Abin37_0321 [Acidobacteriota bacterium]